MINTNKEFTIRTRESSLYLAVMGNASTGIAPKEYVSLFPPFHPSFVSLLLVPSTLTPELFGQIRQHLLPRGSSPHRGRLEALRRPYHQYPPRCHRPRDKGSVGVAGIELELFSIGDLAQRNHAELEQHSELRARVR